MQTPTIYANFVTLKGNPNELVLEFYYHFAQPGQMAPSPTQQPDVRVVLLSTAIDSLYNTLQQAKAARDNAIARQKEKLGFNPQGGAKS